MGDEGDQLNWALQTLARFLQRLHPSATLDLNGDGRVSVYVKNSRIEYLTIEQLADKVRE